uniref:Uncharacterized protein n=1 Tax=Anguilla anguilla TaxID=7936 RepID=A0A0E9RQT4_ANGAN
MQKMRFLYIFTYITSIYN